MDEVTNPIDVPRNVDQTPPVDLKSQIAAIEATRSEIDALLADIHGKAKVAAVNSEDIARLRRQVEESREGADTQLARIREAESGLSQQVDSAKATIADLTALSATLQATNNQTTNTSAEAKAALEAARNQANSVAESANRIEALKTQVEQAAEVAATRSKHIEDGRQYIDAKRAEIDVILNTALQSANNAEAQRVAGQSSLDNLNGLYTMAQTVKAGAESNAEGTATARAVAEGHAVTTKRLAEIAEATESKIGQYEARLNATQEANDTQRKMIDELLLGATNAGLASAWDKRSKTFKSPEQFWQRVFIGSLAGLLGVAIWQAIAHGSMGQAPDWQQLARMLLVKLPFIVPLAWLAIHASRQASFAKRMEEEYAFKATTSMSFEGYRRQMADVGKDLPPDSPLAQLCSNTLRTIAAPPGRIYDKQKMDPTPGTATAEVVKPIVDGVAKALIAKLPDLKQ